MIGLQSKVSGQRSVVGGYTTSPSQLFSSSSMSIIPWSCLLVWLSFPVGLKSSGCCCAAVISVTWCLLPWSSTVIFSVTCHLSTCQVTCYPSTWSSFTWVFLITCYPSTWSSIMWSWFKVENVNRISLSISSRPLRRFKNFDFFIFESYREDGPSQSLLIFE